MNIIEIKDLSFSYSENLHALTDINLEIKRGEWISILGHNGSGKSTLSKLIIGLLKADKGEIYVDGLKLSEETVHDIRRKIGIVFQNPDNQFVGVTVEDDIAFGMENLCFSQPEIENKITEYAAKVNMLEFLKKEPQALSGGQKQRVAIAGILAMSTDIIIFDEATSMLDPKGRSSIMKYIKEINETGVTVITITHDMKEAVLSDRIVILKEGRIIACGDTIDVLNNKSILNSSNLELLLPLQLLHLLEENHQSNEKLKDILWRLSLNK
ncbi:MAG: energy-coupling factor transporter ATPase [Bacilli bacterium]|nr:energy-coupling factor transporter ATPase [Bacilli bacterium]